MEFAADVDLADFSADDKTTFSVVRALEIVGEAAKRVPPAFRRKHPDVPWRPMAGIRDRLIHDYERVDLEVVWKTVHEDLPKHRQQIAQILAGEHRSS